MRTAATPDFRKLWGKVHEDLPPGTYRVMITTSKGFFENFCIMMKIRI